MITIFIFYLACLDIYDVILDNLLDINGNISFFWLKKLFIGILLVRQAKNRRFSELTDYQQVKDEFELVIGEFNAFEALAESDKKLW